MLQNRRERSQQKRWNWTTTLRRERRTIVSVRSADLLPLVDPPNYIKQRLEEIGSSKKTTLVARLASMKKGTKRTSGATATTVRMATVEAVVPVVGDRIVKKAAFTRKTKDDNSKAGAELLCESQLLCIDIP
jgi:hypothetical protein